MSNNTNCPCPTDVTPSTPCCPDTIELGSAIDVRDKDCNPRRIIPGSKGVLAARSNKAGMMDGSADYPLSMDFETALAEDGYVIIQTPGGRVLAIRPDATLAEENAVLHLTYQDGAIKFVPITLENLFNDNNVPAATTGKLALIACAGQGGLIKLGKFLPLPDGTEGGPWNLVIDSDNDVSVSESEIDDCPDASPVDELDSIYGCVDGKWAPILPVVGKKLVGIEGPKWSLADDTGNIVSIARTSVWSRSHVVADAGALDSSNIDITTLLGYAVEYKFAMLHFVYRAATSTSDFTHEVAIDGRRYVGVSLIAEAFGAENNHNSAFVPIPDTKSWNVTNTRTFWQPGSANGGHWIDIYIDGWAK